MVSVYKISAIVFGQHRRRVKFTDDVSEKINLVQKNGRNRPVYQQFKPVNLVESISLSQ